MDEISNKSKSCDNFDDDIFDDSTFLENLQSFDLKDPAKGNKSDAKTDLNISALCCDEELNGYDKLTGQTWIYPTNYPVRDYQFNIIKAAMLKNCLVSLPTGLGKTFIAAVVMYNFYRWYPLGKIIFTAPTRPLVAQQIEACYNIVAMPTKDTIEMTGQMPVNIRKGHWTSKRVFFATPQVIYNDMKSGICPGDKIRCLVFDEAHKARGNYAYGNIIATLSESGHKIYRVLGLSATPGNKVEDVIHVVKHLHISHLELRTENCPDVKVYSHARKINTVVVELGSELAKLRQQYVEILDGYNRKLKNFNIVQNLGNLSKGRIVMLYKEFQSRERGARHPQHNYIMRTFTLLITLYHGLELLVKHGARVFLNFFDEHPEKTWVQFDKDLTSFFDKLRDQLGVNPLSFDRSILPDGTIPEIPSNLNFGHPKFDKLKEIMLEHFNIAKKKGEVTKAIVFCEYRESVNLVHCLLLQCRPTIVPEMFVGHGSGKEGKAVVSQKQQLRVMRNFRAGSCNTLVCTCVAEEGLDVGAVDLILCFDVSTRSPVRLVQRCGRTGRERNGQVFILVTEGREHTTLLDCMRQSDGLNNRILQSVEVKNNLYKYNPRMLPRDFMPECQQMYITVKKELSGKSKKTKDKSKEKSKGKLQKGQQDLLSMFQNKASSSKNPKTDTKSNEGLNKEEFNKASLKDHHESNVLPKPVDNGAMSTEFLSRDNKEELNVILSSDLEFQRNLQDTCAIGYSDDLLLTEHKHKIPIIKSPSKKDGDIRVLFSKTTKSIKDYTKSMKNLGIKSNLNISSEVLNILVDLSLENAAMVKPCYICLTMGNCSKFCKSPDKSNLPVGLCSRSQPVLPDINFIDYINPESLFNLANNNVNFIMDNNKNNSFSEPPFKYSSQLSDCPIEKNADYSTEQNININMIGTRPQSDGSQGTKRFDEVTLSGPNTGNENNNPNSKLQSLEISDDDNILEDNDIFEDIDIPLTCIATRHTINPSDDVHFTKTTTESTIQNNKTGNIDNNADTELVNDTIIIESQKICDNDNIFEDNDVFEDIDMPLTCIASRQPMNPSHDVHITKKTTESTIQNNKTGNNDNNADLELDNDTIIIESQKICNNDNIFEDNDIFEDIDMPLTSTAYRPPINSSDDAHTIKRNVELSVQYNKTCNNDNNVDPELDDDTIIIESQEIYHNDIKIENNDVYEDIKSPNDNNNEIVILDSDKEDDVFEDDDIFDDVPKRDIVTHTQSNLPLDDVLHVTKTTPGTNIQTMEEEDDIYTVNILKYFRLNRISDIFQNVYVESVIKDSVDNVKKTSLLPQTGPKHNDNNQINTIKVECPSSPSLLFNRSTSPILISQKRKINLSINKHKNELKKLSLFDKKTISIHEKTCISPLTEPEHQKTMNSLQQDTNEIIVLDSDDENFDDDSKESALKIEAQATVKRKFQEEPDHRSESPYFSKKQKINENCSKPSTIKEKIIAALSSHQNPDTSFHNNIQINYMATKSPTFKFKKENRDPLGPEKKEKEHQSSKIKVFETKSKSRAILHERDKNIPRKITYIDDDEFETKVPRRKKVLKLKTDRVAVAKEVADFLELEAELSQDASADERSDDSAGSLRDFICDLDPGPRPPPDPGHDIHHIYLQSVKSPVKGVFKLPQLPPLNRAEVLSQYVEEDTYEMDSFCVDSHMILDATNEISELEIAEMILEERRKGKKSKNQFNTQKDEGSPVIRKKHRNIKRQIDSDSDDSS